MTEIAGKIIEVLEPQSGEGKNGTWKKQEYIFETTGEYPRKICVANWNDKVSPEMLKIGEQLTVSVNIESREYNGRWYTDVKMWRAEKPAGAPVAAPPPLTDADAPPPPPEEPDDLPF